MLQYSVIKDKAQIRQPVLRVNMPTMFQTLTQTVETFNPCH